MTCRHVKVFPLLPGEEAERMKPPYLCMRGGCANRPYYRCFTCSGLYCQGHANTLASQVLSEPPPDRPLLQKGDKITSVLDGVVIHCHVKRVFTRAFTWRAVRTTPGPRVALEDELATEGIEWERGHLDDDAAKPLLAANALWRSRF